MKKSWDNVKAVAIQTAKFWCRLFPNKYSILRSPRKFFLSLVLDVDFKDDEQYRLAKTVADKQVQTPCDDPVRSQLILETAKTSWEFHSKALERLDEKADGFLKFTAATAAFLAAAAQSLHFERTTGLTLAFLALVVAMCILALTRGVRPKPMSMSIQSAREGLPSTPSPEDWIAGSLYKTCEAIKFHQNIAAAHINCAILFLVAGMILFIIQLLRVQL